VPVVFGFIDGTSSRDKHTWRVSVSIINP
jgi:hypothetical protein